MQTINITLKDLYQFLIAECRYGYSRNNHLMPDGAYDHVRAYLPTMALEDKQYAVDTAKQLCEECISDELIQFSNGVDDDINTRENALKFIVEMMDFVHTHGEFRDKEWKPYNYHNYLDNKALDDAPRYNIYETQYNSLSADASSDHKFNFEENIAFFTPINKEKLSKNNFLNYLCLDILGLEEVFYRKWNICDDSEKRITKYVFDDLKRIFYVVLEKNNY